MRQIEKVIGKTDIGQKSQRRQQRAGKRHQPRAVVEQVFVQYAGEIRLQQTQTQNEQAGVQKIPIPGSQPDHQAVQADGEKNPGKRTSPKTVKAHLRSKLLATE